MPTEDKFTNIPPGDVDPLDHYAPSVRPSPPDERDHRPTAAPPRTLPAQAKTRYQNPVRTQGRGDCMIFAAIRVLENELLLAGVEQDLSEAFLSYLYLESTGELGQDVGTDPRSAMRLCTDVGAVLEADDPYTPNPSHTAPQLKALAGRLRTLEYVRADDAGDPDETLRQVKAMIAEGRKVVACFTLMRNFSSVHPGGGVMPIPAGGVWGGHAMTLGAYDDTYQVAGRGAGAFVAVLQNGFPLGGMENQWGGSQITVPYDLFRLKDWRAGNGDQGGVWATDLWTFRGIATDRFEIDPTPEPATYTKRQILDVAAAAVTIIQGELAEAHGNARRDKRNELAGALRTHNALRDWMP